MAKQSSSVDSARFLVTLLLTTSCSLVVDAVQYKLIYFKGRGRAECARQIFALADQKYEDVRVTQEEFPKMKPNMPFGQLPVLYVDGKELAQSNAINRYLARKFGFAGKTPFEEAVVDSLADQYVDYSFEIKPYVYTALGFKKFGELVSAPKKFSSAETLKKDVLLPARDKFFGFITKFLKKNPSGFLVGNSVTWVDLLIAEHVSGMLSTVPEYIEGFPEVKAHMEKVQSIPKVKKWIESRPKTDY
ncbi:glutathione S-transferase protein [Ancylostoma caninum]|uniref:glutathione transferase n=1 Tax=Ancylostoma caninum TaxID=29170 RepID=A0A368H244_ANCCA|nr:glutathione S-transferase protein [Ancylostoma caninum]